MATDQPGLPYDPAFLQIVVSLQINHLLESAMAPSPDWERSASRDVTNSGL